MGLPIEKSSDVIKRISLPADHRETLPSFMHLADYKKILGELSQEEQSREAAIEFMSASQRFNKKPFLRQMHIAKRMAREKANYSMGLYKKEFHKIQDLSRRQMV